MEPLCDLVIPFLSIYLKVPKSAYHGDTCRLVFIVAQFTTAKLRNPPRCLQQMNRKTKLGSRVQHVYSPVDSSMGRGPTMGICGNNKGIIRILKGKENMGERWSITWIWSKHIIYMYCRYKTLYFEPCSLIWKTYVFKSWSPLCLSVVAVVTCRSQNCPQPSRVDLTMTSDSRVLLIV